MLRSSRSRRFFLPSLSPWRSASNTKLATRLWCSENTKTPPPLIFICMCRYGRSTNPAATCGTERNSPTPRAFGRHSRRLWIYGRAQAASSCGPKRKSPECWPIWMCTSSPAPGASSFTRIASTSHDLQLSLLQPKPVATPHHSASDKTRQPNYQPDEITQRNQPKVSQGLPVLRDVRAHYPRHQRP